jgi:hypothetical protein
MVRALGCALAIVTTFAVLPAVAQQSEGELAKEALNPVAALLAYLLNTITTATSVRPSRATSQS